MWGQPPSAVLRAKLENAPAAPPPRSATVADRNRIGPLSSGEQRFEAALKPLPSNRL
jgi:hypothetical protein